MSQRLQMLGIVADRILRMTQNAEEIHAVFNNNRDNFAPVAAEKLQKIIGHRLLATQRV